MHCCSGDLEIFSLALPQYCDSIAGICAFMNIHSFFKPLNYAWYKELGFAFAHYYDLFSAVLQTNQESSLF